MKTILVSGASGIVGYGCLKSLRLANERYKLIGTTIYEDSIAPAFCDLLELAPMTTSDNYINWLCGIIEKHNVDLIIPGIEVDMHIWAQYIDVLMETGVRVLLNNLRLIRLCSDKWRFYEETKEVEETSIYTKICGEFSELAKELGLPFILKPRSGFASRGIIRVGNKDDFLPHKTMFGDILLAQPIVGCDEEEYTTSAFFDKNSDLCCHMTLRRKLSKLGFTEKAYVVDLPEVVLILKRLAGLLLPVGPTNFQFRRENGKLKLLEINPRISSSTSIRAAFGYNESIMGVNYYLYGVVPMQPHIKFGSAIRYVEDYIIYDCDNI